MNPAYYRVRLFSDLCQTFVLPLVVSHLLLYSLDYRTSWLYVVSFDIISVIFWAALKTLQKDAIQQREARSLNARHIPRVIGVWPGNVDVLFRMMRAFKTSYVLDVYLRLFEEYHCTTLNLRILWRDSIITMDQEHAKYVLATGFHRFWRGNAQKERMETFLGCGIFNRDDDVWKMHRAIARPFFARERIQDFDIFERYTSHTLSILTSLSASNEPCDVQDLYARFTLDAASEFLFGKNLDTLSESLPVPGKTTMGPKGSATEGTWGSFARSFETAQQNITNRGRIGHLWPLFELFGDKNEPHAKVVHQWLEPLVQNALEEKHRGAKAGISSPIAEKTFLQHLAESTDDPVVIRDQLLSMLLASRDTTASVLTFITYFMAIHPEVASKLRAEVLEHCGLTRPGTFDDFRSMKYLRAVINETLRLFPPVPLNVRESRSCACVLPPPDSTFPALDQRPLYVPRSTTITYLPLLTQRNPALWGEDADEFDPERWIDPKRLAKFVANPTMFTPFSAGPRICLGQNYAYNQMSYFLVRLLQQFESFTLATEFQPEGSTPPPEWKHRNGRQRTEQIWPSAALTLYVKGGLWVHFHRTKA